MTLRLTILLACLSVCLCATAYADPVLIVSGSGNLLGADGVLVNGNYYNVRFVDGTCASVFGVCDQAHFTFTTVAAALAASQALLNQVLVDGTYLFDSAPGLTAGCSASEPCTIFTPYDTPNGAVLPITYVQNWINDGTDSFAPGTISSTFDFTNSNTEVYAVWTLAAVPEPSTITSLGLGLLALAGLRHRRSSKRHRPL